MKTRSQAKIELQKNEFIINFDEASSAWLRNKVRLQNGCYKYKPTSTLNYMKTRSQTKNI